MPRNKRSFLERLTGVVETDQEYDEFDDYESADDFRDNDEASEAHSVDLHDSPQAPEKTSANYLHDQETGEGELMVDVYQTDTDIVIQAMVAGVSAEDLDISISQEVVTIKGRREEPAGINENDYFTNELYWGPFSRTILLPQEIESDEAEAMEKNGLLMIRLPKVDKERTKQIHVKSV